MKRRNADCGKIRRPIKRNKITESMHSNTFLYMKFLILWAIVIIADFMLEFRFEFLWPFWLLLRSVHDSFKYKGLAFSVLFVCIAITSDLICLFFIPVHWLFFAASTYVWVQYVWHTDKGICLPTIILWMLFVYLEAAIRWKDSRHMPHLDLCRPFAAHCIGYPVVSLGFGFKSYVGHLMRIRKQREVAKENEFYMQLLQQALPQLPADEQTVCLPDDETSTATLSSSTTAANTPSPSSNGIQTLNGDISCGAANVTNSSSSSLVGGLGALTGELIKDLIEHTNSLVSSATQHFMRGSGANNNAQTTTTNSSSSNNKVLSLGGSNSAGNSSSSTTSNGHAVGVPNGGNNSTATSTTATSGNSGSHQSQANHNHNNSSSSSKDRTSQGAAPSGSSSGGSGSSATTSTVGNGGIRNNNNNHKQAAHNGSGGTTSERDNKCDFNSNSNKGSYHQSAASGNGGATAMLSAALMLSTASVASNGSLDKPLAKEGKGDYATMNGSSSSGSKAGGNEYHQQQQQHHQSTKENNRLANNQSSSGGGGGGGAVHNAHTDKSTSGDSTNHITSASSSAPLSASMSNSSSLEATGGGGGGGVGGKKANGHQHDTSTESHSVMVNGGGGGGGGGNEKSKGKKNRSRQKLEEDRQLSLMQICTSCSRLEMEVKRLKGDVSHVKQIENELKQRTDTNANLKANLQAKNKECEDLEKKLHDLTSGKQSDRQMLNSLEQRLGYEQRQRKQLETALTNERKLRIKSEEKAAKCYTEIASIDEKKKSAELQNRSYEVEMRKMENELRNRDSEEVLLTALQSVQQKNMSLEESLSRETRFKLDLFSALGEARRQIELKDGVIGKQMDEITDLKAKIAQLVAIMPIMPISPTRPDSGVGVGYHHTSPTVPVVSSSGSMLRLSNGSPLMVNSSQDMNNNGNDRSMKLLGQSPQPQMYIQQQQQLHQMNQQQQQQQQGASNLDPNARAYTPVNTNSD